jgi:hypothetical protein
MCEKPLRKKKLRLFGDIRQKLHISIILVGAIKMSGYRYTFWKQLARADHRVNNSVSTTTPEGGKMKGCSAILRSSTFLAVQ